MHLYLREVLILLVSFLIFATTTDFISIYLLGLGDPKFSPWGNIQLGEVWGQVLQSYKSCDSLLVCLGPSGYNIPVRSIT